jgi:hypothetical protein
MTLYKGPHSLFRALAPKYQLNKAEYLQLYNLRPSTGVALELIIEEVRLLTSVQETYPSPLQEVENSWSSSLTDKQAGSRFNEDELHDILTICQQVFEEDEAEIPDGVENIKMPKIDNKLLGAKKGKRRAKKKA